MNTIPLYGHDGSVRAEAIVDHDVAERLAQYRWSLHATQGPVRWVRVGNRGGHQTMRREVLDLPAFGGPTVYSRNGDLLDLRRSNLQVARGWILRRLDDDPDVERAVVTLLVKAVA